MINPVRLLSLLAVSVSISLPVQAGMIETEGLAPYEICGMCHNLDGISFMAKFPKLAGQKPDYLKAQFLHFNTESRSNDGGQMQAITTEVDMTKLDEIADYFANLPPPPANPDVDDLTLIPIGRQLYQQGKEGVAACTSCHSDVASSAPWLYGQHANYLQKQLEDFAAGDRESPEMQTVANHLSETEMQAVASYLASIQPRIQ